MTPTNENEGHAVGDYLVTRVGNDWRVMEQFGSHRMLKKKFKTRAAAEKRAESMPSADVVLRLGRSHREG